MAKPRELFNTPAPQAMGQMGQGIADAYARAGEIQGKGYQALGQGIAQGISAVGQAYSDYKKMDSQVKAQEKSLDTFMPYLPQEIQATITQQREALNNNPKASLADKKAYYDNTMSFAGGALGQYYKMQQIEAEQGGMLNREIAKKEPVPNLSGTGESVKGLKSVTGSNATPSASSPVENKGLVVTPTPAFDESQLNAADYYMRQKYGANWRQSGIRISNQDLIDSGIIKQ